MTTRDPLNINRALSLAADALDKAGDDLEELRQQVLSALDGRFEARFRDAAVEAYSACSAARLALKEEPLSDVHWRDPRGDNEKSLCGAEERATFTGEVVATVPMPQSECNCLGCKVVAVAKRLP